MDTGTLNVNGSLSKIIDSAIALYVDPAGSDVTGDGSIGNPWATLGHAVDYLDDFRISNAGSVTIIMVAGAHTLDEIVTIDHLDGERINIQGEVLATTFAISSIVSATGSTRDWAIVLQMDTVTDIEEGDFIVIRGTPYTDTDFPDWAPNTAYAVGDWVRATFANDYGYVFECTTAGTSAAVTEPTWGTDDTTVPIDSTIADGVGTLVWTKRMQPVFIAGGFKVTNVDVGNTRITIESGHNSSYQPKGNLSNYTVTGVVVKTVVTYSSQSYYIGILSRLGGLYNIVLDGGNVAWTSGKRLLVSGVLERVDSSVVLYNNGIGIYVEGAGSTCISFRGCLTKNRTGAYLYMGGTCTFYNSLINGIYGYAGIQVWGAGSTAYITLVKITGCHSYGIYVTKLGHAVILAGAIVGNFRGLNAYTQGRMVAYGPTTYVKGNVDYKIRALSDSRISYPRYNDITNPDTSYGVHDDNRGTVAPAFNTLDTDQSFISTLFYF